MRQSKNSRARAAAWLLCLPLCLAACEATAPPDAAPLPFPPAPPAYAPPPAAPPSSPTQVSAYMSRWFRGKGYKDFQVLALLDHAHTESGFRPCAAGPSGLRYTYQWGGLRLLRLQAYAQSNGACPPLDKQLEFADNELRSEPKYACFWQATSRPAAAAALLRGFGRGSC